MVHDWRVQNRNKEYPGLFLLYLGNLFFITAYGAYFLLPVHLRALGASNAAVGAITAATGITNAASLGWLLVSGFKRDSHALMLFGAVFFGAGCLGMAVSDDLAVIAVMRMFQGAGFCLYFIAANTWVSHHVPEMSLARHLGYLGVATLLAQTVAPTIAEYVARAYGYKFLFGVTAAFILASMALIAALPGGEGHGADPATDAGDGRRMGALPLLVLALTGGGLYGAVVFFSPLYLLECGIEPLSLFFICYASSAVAVRIVLRDAADRIGRLQVARWCFGLLALSVLIMSYSRSIAPFAFASALFGMGHGLMYPALAAYSAGAVRGGRLKGMAVWAGGFAIGVSLGSWVAGGIAELFPIPVMFRASLVFPLAAVYLSRPGPVAEVEGDG